MTKHMATELITGVNHFQSLTDKPIKLEISLKSSWRSSQLECKIESARIEAYFSLYTPLLPLTTICLNWTNGLLRLINSMVTELECNEGSDETEGYSALYPTPAFKIRDNYVILLNGK